MLEQVKARSDASHLARELRGPIANEAEPLSVALLFLNSILVGGPEIKRGASQPDGRDLLRIRDW